MHGQAAPNYVLQRTPGRYYVSTNYRGPAPLNTALDPMASIGLILKCDCDVAEMPANFVPAPLGHREIVEAAIAELLPPGDSTLALTLRVEELGESIDPRTITVSGAWADRELAIIHRPCARFDARFYDAETCEFI